MFHAKKTVFSMTQKIFGAVFVLAVSFYIGMMLAANERRRVAELEAFYHLMERIRDSIASLAQPISEICLQYTDETLEKNGFLPRLRDLYQNGMKTENILYRAILEQDAAHSFQMTAEDVSVLTNYAVSCGQEDSTGEVRRCTYYLSLLEKRLNDAKTALSANTKISRALPLSLGGLLIIMLL